MTLLCKTLNKKANINGFTQQCITTLGLQYNNHYGGNTKFNCMKLWDMSYGQPQHFCMTRKIDLKEG